MFLGRDAHGSIHIHIHIECEQTYVYSVSLMRSLTGGIACVVLVGAGGSAFTIFVQHELPTWQQHAWTWAVAYLDKC